jgi:hypothetical protein
MRRAAVILVLGLLAAGCDQGVVEETTVPTTLPTTSTTLATTTTGPITTITGAASTTTAAPTTTIPLLEIVAAPIPAEGDYWPVGLEAISAREAWTFGYFGDLIGHLEDGIWEYWRVTGGGIAFGLAVAPDGTVWSATSIGVFSFDGANWTRRFDDLVIGVIVDEGGTVWVSNGMWLAQWDGESWVRRDPTPPDLPGGSSAAMAALPDGDMWIASTGWWNTVIRYHGDTVEEVHIGDYPDPWPATALGPVGVFALEAAPNGDMWVGGILDGSFEFVVARFNGEAWTIYDWPFPDPSDLADSLADMAMGPDGVLWFAFQGGLASFDGTEWTTWVEGQYVYAVDVAPDGTVWVSDEQGVHTLTP